MHPERLADILQPQLLPVLSWVKPLSPQHLQFRLSEANRDSAALDAATQALREMALATKNLGGSPRLQSGERRRFLPNLENQNLGAVI
jgi:hypothetical protein